MKVICIGDPHFRTDNIEDVNIFIGKMKILCEEERPDFIVVLGDLLHTHERLHTLPLNKAYEFIDILRKIAYTYVLVGNHDMCFSEYTLIRTDNGTKYAKDIKITDSLIGRDNSVKKITSIISGSDYLYRVVQDNTMDYIVNLYHTLYLRLDCKTIINTDVGYSVLYINNELDANFKHFVILEDALSYYDSLGERYRNIKLTVNDYFNLEHIVKDRLYSINIHEKMGRVNVYPSSYGKYYGFAIEGEPLFLLEDGTIVHNCNNQQFLTSNHWMNGLKEWKDVEIVDVVKKCIIGGHKFLFCPYTPPGKFIEALNTVDDWKDTTCIFAHQEFYGCKMGAIMSVEGDKWDESYPYVISGHIHNRQFINNNIYYCGSSMQHAFGESEDNIIPIITWNKDGKRDVIEKDLEMAKKKIVYTDIEKVENMEIKDHNEKVKISISGSYDEFKAFKKTKKYKDLIKKGTKVVFKAKKVKDIDNSIPEDYTDFRKNLQALVGSEKNPFLTQAYELIINNNNISYNDIFYMD